MAVIKAADLVSFIVDINNAGWGYVYSGQGHLYTRELAKKWGSANRAGKDYNYFVNKCARWYGKNVVDCSGLIIEGFRSKIPGYGDKTANTLYKRSVRRGSISSVPNIPGLCVWRNGHIGIYIGDDTVIESGGTNVGVVSSPLYAPATNKQWSNWGKMADVDYSNAETPPNTGEPAAFWLGRLLKLKHPYIRGADVASVQEVLSSKSFSPGKIDGIYGTKTQNAVIRFQQFSKLKVDGIVGVNTSSALGGVWVTDNDGNSYCPAKEKPLGSFEVDRLLKITSPFTRGADVLDVQDALKLNGFSPGSSDGIYGKKTKGAVILFQKEKKLKVDGIVGKETTTALCGLWTGK